MPWTFCFRMGASTSFSTTDDGIDGVFGLPGVRKAVCCGEKGQFDE